MNINISIDDVSPHPFSSTKVLQQCMYLIDKLPDIKFTLFVPISYWRTIKAGTTTSRPLDLREHPEFCKTLLSLPRDNFEIAYHGLYHGIPGKTDNDEFQFLTYDQASEKFDAMFSIVKECNLEEVFKPIFRPPAWRMSSHSIKAARDKGIKILALSSKEYAKATYGKVDEEKRDVVYYTCNPPFDALQRFEKNEIVYHACEWDRNYFNEELSKQLLEWIKINEDIKFEHMEGILNAS